MKTNLHILANQILALSAVTTQPLPCLTREEREALVVLHDDLMATYVKQAEMVRKSANLTPREVERCVWRRSQEIGDHKVVADVTAMPDNSYRYRLAIAHRLSGALGGKRWVEDPLQLTGFQTTVRRAKNRVIDRFNAEVDKLLKKEPK